MRGKCGHIVLLLNFVVIAGHHGVLGPPAKAGKTAVIPPKANRSSIGAGTNISTPPGPVPTAVHNDKPAQLPGRVYHREYGWLN
jgi:hypothetical protein